MNQPLPSQARVDFPFPFFAMPPSSPSLSVVVVTPERFENVRRTVRHLRAQTVQGQIELVLVAPSEHALDDAQPDELEGFQRITTVTPGPIANVDRAGAHGVFAAHAPVVTLIEDHAFPQPGWAEALLAAHQDEPWDVVGPVVLNANPDHMLSWTNLLIAYGAWTQPAAGGEVEALPGHNISYKTERLTAYGDRLPAMLVRGGGLLDDLKAQGARFYLEPAARIAHTNPSRLDSTVRLRFNAGRLYGARRAADQGWSLAKRTAYVAGGPLIPLVRFKRLREELFGHGRRASLVPRVFPALLLGLILDGAGQMAGYAFGAGSAPRILATFEMDRFQHLTATDRRALTDTPPRHASHA